MPELPEVETLKLGLEKKLPGLRIKKIEVLNPKSFQANPKLLGNKKVLNVLRRAKILCINYERDLSLLIHLKMSGQLIYQGKEKLIGGHPTKDMKGQMPNKSTRVIFEFSDNSKLFFNDQRKFGWIKLVKTNELGILSHLIFKNLGPEPLEKKFTWEVLKERLRKRLGTAIKVAIMDQQVISGVGNIYACEALFISKIDPRTKVKDISNKRFKLLHNGIIKSLKDGIKYGGSTRTHFINTDGEKGLFLDHAFVYNKTKKPCKSCKTYIQKITLGGRGTYFCPKCQA